MPFSTKFQVSAFDTKTQTDPFHDFRLDSEEFAIDPSICFSIIYADPYKFNVTDYAAKNNVKTEKFRMYNVYNNLGVITGVWKKITLMPPLLANGKHNQENQEMKINLDAFISNTFMDNIELQSNDLILGKPLKL